MKIIFGLMIIACTSVFAADMKIADYDWTITDIASRGLKKESLYTSMDRDFVKTGSSICSNRAHMWSNDFKKNLSLDTAKIFLFYTKKKAAGISQKAWWYHVSPVVNESNQIWVMDAGFPGWIKTPLTIEQWLFKFSNSNNCKEIKSSETELVELMFDGLVFPHQTSYGYYDCYYKIVPHTIWTPNVLASNLLGVDESGRPTRVERPEILDEELYQACLEATTSKFGYALGNSKQKCKDYVNQ